MLYNANKFQARFVADCLQSKQLLIWTVLVVLTFLLKEKSVTSCFPSVCVPS